MQLDLQLNIYVQALMEENLNLTWDKIKQKELVEGLTDQSKERLFDSISDMKNNLDEDQYDLMNQVKCKLVLLEIKSGRSDIVNKDKPIKQKLIQGLPRPNRDRLELFQEANNPLTMFLDKLSHERITAQDQGGRNSKKSG